MRDEDLRRGLEAVEGDEPSPDFVDRLRRRYESELVDAGPSGPTGSGLPGADDIVEVPVGRIPDDGGEPSPSGTWWARGAVALAAAVILLVVGIVVATGDDDEGSRVAVGDDAVEQGYPASVLPDAIVQERDPGVATVDRPAVLSLDDFWPAADQPLERAAYVDAGFVDGISGRFSQDIAIAPELGGRSVAHRFENAQGAVAALGFLEEWYRVIWAPESNAQLAAVLDVDVGDEATALFFRSVGSQNPVILWRNDNVVHILRAEQVFEGPDGDGVASVQTLARAIDARMSALGQ